MESARTGILLRPRDVAALAEALRRLSYAPALRFRMGQAGREKVLKEFNLKTNTATLAELIRQVAKTPRAEQIAIYSTPLKSNDSATFPHVRHSQQSKRLLETEGKKYYIEGIWMKC